MLRALGHFVRQLKRENRKGKRTAIEKNAKEQNLRLSPLIIRCVCVPYDYTLTPAITNQREREGGRKREREGEGDGGRWREREREREREQDLWLILGTMSMTVAICQPSVTSN